MSEASLAGAAAYLSAEYQRQQCERLFPPPPVLEVSPEMVNAARDAFVNVQCPSEPVAYDAMLAALIAALGAR